MGHLKSPVRIPLRDKLPTMELKDHASYDDKGSMLLQQFDSRGGVQVHRDGKVERNRQTRQQRKQSSDLTQVIEGSSIANKTAAISQETSEVQSVDLLVSKNILTQGSDKQVLGIVETHQKE